MNEFPQADGRKPIWLISGFLGVGKTTLLNHLLRTSWNGQRVAVAVNDFGKVSLDAELLQPSAEQVVALPNGCVCCVIQGALVDGLRRLLEADYDRIVVETSGVSDPGKVRKIIEAPPLAALGRLESVIVVAHALRHTLLRKVVLLIDEQVRQASVVVLNQIDQATQEQQLETLAAIRAANPEVPVLPVSQGRVEPHLLAGRVQSPAPAGPGGPAQNWDSYEIRFADPVGSLQLREALGRLPQGLLRLKGFVRDTTGELLHVEWNGRLEVTAWSAPVSAAATGVLTAIGSLSPQALREAFAPLAGVEVAATAARMAH